MALFPVQGIVEGDFVVVLVTADDTDPMTVVAQTIAHHGIGTRVAAQDRPLKVRYQGTDPGRRGHHRQHGVRADGRPRGRLRMSGSTPAG